MSTNKLIQVRISFTYSAPEFHIYPLNNTGCQMRPKVPDEGQHVLTKTNVQLVPSTCCCASVHHPAPRPGPAERLCLLSSNRLLVHMDAVFAAVHSDCVCYQLSLLYHRLIKVSLSLSGSFKTLTTFLPKTNN